MNISRLKCGLKPQRNSVIFFIIVDFNIGCNSRWSTQNDKFRLCKTFPQHKKVQPFDCTLHMLLFFSGYFVNMFFPLKCHLKGLIL